MSEETSTTIKFTHGENGSIDLLSSGDSNLSYIRSIFAVVGASKKLPGGTGWEYPTDTEGLKLLEERTGEVITTLSIWLGLLGKVLVYADRDEITKDLDALGWVITGLSGLSQNLSEERAMIRFTLACPGGIRHD